MTCCPVCKGEFYHGRLFFSWETGWVVTELGSARLTPAESDIFEIVRKSSWGITLEALSIRYCGAGSILESPKDTVRQHIFHANKKLKKIGYKIWNTSGGYPALYVLVKNDARYAS